jgi:ribose 1,5-bisphosphokinase
VSGLFVAIVGPSGAGKDTLIRALAQRFSGDPRFAIVKRVVTRPSDDNEDHDTLDSEAFDAQARAGRFALTWAAHGLRYGVPIEVDQRLASGMTLVCNLSRAAVAEARNRWPDVLAALITARPETLAARLSARGREAAADRRSRLERASPAEVALTADAIIENDGELSQAVDRLQSLIRSRRRAAA